VGRDITQIKACTTLTGVAKLQGRIEKATERIAQNFDKALKEVEELKTKINDLELSISDSGYGKRSADMNQLNSAMDMLNKVTDSMISESERAWEEYKKLERDCKTDASEPSELNGLRDLCKKTEKFAADLLCYSLARFKRKDA
jgi:chromosome segregation ATPase